MPILVLENTGLILSVVTSLIIVWLIILTILFINLKQHYQRLLDKTNKKNLQDTLNQILDTMNKQGQSLSKLREEIETILTDNTFNLQYLGFLRFNPFDETGGEQSFALSLLDQHKNGFVISSLHSRENTRIYAKKVINGKSDEFPLSEEESKAIATAKALKTMVN